MLPVWFACGTCRGSFQKLNDFLQHKKILHLKEFQNTKCIIFEERVILSNDQIGDFLFTTSKQEKNYCHDDHVDLSEVKVENENNFGRSNHELQSITDETADEFVKIDHKSNEYDSGNNLDGFIPLKSITSKNSDFSCKPSLTNSCISQKSISKNNLDFKNTNDAIKNTNSTSLRKSDSSSHIKFIQARHNPFVLVRRLTIQEIQNYCASEKNTNSKYAVKADSSGRRRDDLRTRSVSFAKPQSVILQPSKKVKNSFECKLCLEKFNSDSKLIVHLSSCSVTHPHRHRFCIPCNQKYYKKNNLVKHVARCHAATKAKYCNSKKMKQCDRCPKTFLYESELSRHAWTHIDDTKSLKCPKANCHKSLKTKQRLLDHLKTHADLLPFKCPRPNCTKSCKTEQCLRDHMIIHSDSRPFKCPENNCVGRYKTKCNLMNHLKAHENENPTVQSDYKPESRSVNAAAAAVATEHYTGNYSKADYRTIKSLNVGQGAVKRGFIWFKCTQPNCAKQYKKYCELKLHLRTHSDLRLIKCPEEGCEKSFKFIGILRQHMFTHSDARPFECPKLDCKKCFKSKMNLRRHLMTHSDTQLLRFHQLNCKKTYKTKIRLQQHLKRHTEDAPFKCEQVDCKKGF